MCRLIAEAWSIHTVIVMFQHELFVHSDAALVRHCDSLTFVYILPPELPNGILFINRIFKLKEQTSCNVYNIISEAWNIQACKCITVLWHTSGDTADMEEYLSVLATEHS